MPALAKLPVETFNEAKKHTGDYGTPPYNMLLLNEDYVWRILMMPPKYEARIKSLIERQRAIISEFIETRKNDRRQSFADQRVIQDRRMDEEMDGRRTPDFDRRKAKTDRRWDKIENDDDTPWGERVAQRRQGERRMGERRQPDSDRRAFERRSQADRRATPNLNSYYQFLKTYHLDFLLETRALFKEIYGWEFHDEVSGLIRFEDVVSSTAVSSDDGSTTEKSMLAEQCE